MEEEILPCRNRVVRPGIEAMDASSDVSLDWHTVHDVLQDLIRRIRASARYRREKFHSINREQERERERCDQCARARRVGIKRSKKDKLTFTSCIGPSTLIGVFARLSCSDLRGDRCCAISSFG